jgi:hypothetical protein
MTMRCFGNAEIRVGDEDIPLVTSSMVDPVILLDLNQIRDDESGSRNFELQTLRVTGERGATISMRLERLPGRATDDAGGAMMRLTCFGPTSLDLLEQGERVTLSMLRRVQMLLEPDADGGLPPGEMYEMTSGYLEISGRFRELEDGSTSLRDVSLDATQNVRLEAPEMRGLARELRYREVDGNVDLRLQGDPSLEMARESREGTDSRLVIRSRNTIFATFPMPEDDGPALDEVSMRVTEGARVQQFSNNRPEWLISGREVLLDSKRAEDGRMDHRFSGWQEGFTPLLRVFEQRDTDLEFQRASVFGAYAEGEVQGGVVSVTVEGTDSMVVAHADLPLAEQLRFGLGTRGEIRGERNDGRLALRANESLSLRTIVQARDPNRDRTQDPLEVSAIGRVTLDYEPLPRDDARYVTLTGDEAGLRLRGGELVRAWLRSETGDALATLGYDLLICRELQLVEVEGGVEGEIETHISGPGRLIVRDEESVRYFREVLSRLPRRGIAVTDVPEPDAGWLNFKAGMTIASAPELQTLSIGGPEAELIFGEFVKPRAGRGALNDLPEMEAPEVRTLYRIIGGSAYLESTRAEPGAPAINVLRLEGDARVVSRLDGVEASAELFIELTGSDRQRTEDSPFTVVMQGDPQLLIDDAGEFFGDYVQSGVFAYNGVWKIHAGTRLEVTLRPVDAAWGTQEALDETRRLIATMRNPMHPMPERMGAAARVVQVLEDALGPTRPEAPSPELEQPWNALTELRLAHRELVRAYGMPDGRREVATAMRHARRARQYLSVLVDVVGDGGSGEVRGHFHARNDSTPPLQLVMGQATFTFNGLGEIADLDARGPIAVSRASYTLRGSSLSRSPGGALILDEASVDLPADTGVEVSGVREIRMLQKDSTIRDDSGARHQRRMVTRVTGVEMRVRATLAPEPEAEQQE